jgi:hypothetical protein
VSARICPHCKTEVPAPEIAAHSDNVECPKCGARLEVASGARTISSACGLGAAAIAWRLASGSTGDLSGVLPTLYAFLAFGIVSALALMLTANLRNAPLIPVAEPVHASGPADHSVGGHGGGHH